MRERGGDQIAGGSVFLTALLADAGGGEGFEFTKRNPCGFLMRLHQSLVIQRHRQHRNGFGRGAGEIIKHPALVFFLLPLRQSFAGFGILVFTERMKLFARDFFQSQPFRARADPLAGTDFTGGVVIVLRQMLVEILSASARFLCATAVNMEPILAVSQKALFQNETNRTG
jgi:hypothetical protein